MRKSPEGKWQKASVPLDGATLAVMQEHVRMRWASLSTDMRLSCFPCFDWMIGPAVHSCLISRNPPFDRPMKQKWGGCLKKKKKNHKVRLCYCQAAERTSWSIRGVWNGRTPQGRDPVHASRDLCATESAAQIGVIRRVKPSGANSPETLDLSELIRPREAQADTLG